MVVVLEAALVVDTVVGQQLGMFQEHQHEDLREQHRLVGTDKGVGVGYVGKLVEVKDELQQDQVDHVDRQEFLGNICMGLLVVLEDILHMADQMNQYPIMDEA